MFGTIWECEFTFSTVNFIKYEYKASISDKDLASEFRCTLSRRYTPDFEDSVWKKRVENSC